MMSTFQNNEANLSALVNEASVIQAKGKWAFENELSSLITSYRQGDVQKEVFYNNIYPLMKQFCRYVKNHSRSDYFTNEIMDNVVQNVMIGFFKYTAEKVDLENNFIGYLYRSVLREVYQHNRESHVIKTSGQKDENGNKIHFAKVSSIDSAFDDSEKPSDGMLATNTHEFAEYDSLNNEAGTYTPHGLTSLDGVLDKEKALNKLRKLIEENGNCLYHSNNKSYKQMKDNFNMSETPKVKAESILDKINLGPIGVAGVRKESIIEVKPKGAVVKRKNKINLNKENMSPEKKILTDIRESLCLSVEDFAEAVGVSTYVMSSYLYREEVNPKPWVVKAAQELIGEHSESYKRISKLKAQYGNKRMSEILKDWSEKLNFNLESTKLVAAIFDTTPTTILRWKNDSNKPPILSLSSYYDIAVLNISSGKVTEFIENEKKSKVRVKKEVTV